MKSKHITLILAASLLGGCAGYSEAPAGAGSEPGYALHVEIGSSKELCFDAAKGALVTYRFEADGPLEFNLHYHVDQRVYYPVPSHRVAAEKGQLRVPADQAYCLMWTNQGETAVGLSVDLVGAGEATVH